MPMARVLQFAVIFHRGGGDVHVDPADSAVFVVDAVDGLDAVEDVLDRVVDRILPRFDGQPLMPHVLQGDHFLPYFLLGELFPSNVLIFQVIRTVQTAVYAVIRKVQGRKHDDAVAVKGQLYLLRNAVDFLHLFRGCRRPAGQKPPGGSALCDRPSCGFLGSCFV